MRLLAPTSWERLGREQLSNSFRFLGREQLSNSFRFLGREQLSNVYRGRESTSPTTTRFTEPDHRFNAVVPSSKIAELGGGSGAQGGATGGK